MKISIITINLNNADGLLQTIKSVISQKNVSYEYIIIDGGSTDNSIEIIKQYSHQINYWISEKDSGIYNAMNKGVRESTGDYLIFMNSGDSFYSDDVLFKVCGSSNNSDIMVGIEWCYRKNFRNKRIPPQKINLDTCMTIMHQAAFIKRSLLLKYPYDESYKIAGDLKFFCDAFIIENCSYQALNIEVSNFNLEGVSNTLLREPESPRILKELFEYYNIPERISSTFYEYRNGKSELDKKIRMIGYNTLSYHIILKFVSLIIIIRKWIKSILKKSA